MARRARTADDVLEDIAAVRARISELRGCFAKQNALYVEGFEMGIPFATMAQAGGEELAVNDQAVRAVIRREFPETRQEPVRKGVKMPKRKAKAKTG